MKYPYFADHSRETFDMVLETAMRMGKGILYPALSEMDKKPPQFKDGKVFVHPLRTSHSTGGRSTPAATSSPKSFRRSTALPPV
jgi:hypothetical protein